MASPVFKIDKIKAPKFKDRGRFAPHECNGALVAAKAIYGKHSFKIAWDCIDGWHLLDGKVKVALWNMEPATNLKKCPFCECGLIAANKVEII